MCEIFNKVIRAKVTRENSWIDVSLFLEFDLVQDGFCIEYSYKIAAAYYGLMLDSSIEETDEQDVDKKFEGCGGYLSGLARQAVDEAQEGCLEEDEQDAYDDYGQENEISYKYVKYIRCQNRFGKRLVQRLLDEGTSM